MRSALSGPADKQHIFADPAQRPNPCCLAINTFEQRAKTPTIESIGPEGKAVPSLDLQAGVLHQTPDHRIRHGGAWPPSSEPRIERLQSVDTPTAQMNIEDQAAILTGQVPGKRAHHKCTHLWLGVQKEAEGGYQIEV